MSALVQQTDEWLEMRKNKIGASDASIIMEVSPWKTPYKLWLEKLNIVDDHKKSFAMQRGLELEDTARIMFTLETGIEVAPSVLFHPTQDWMMASLDGISSDKKNIVEIKCSGKEDHEKAKSGEVPEKYYPQLQHQLEVSGLDMVYYFSFDGSEGVLLTVSREDKYIKKMVSKEKEFWECLQDFTPPKMLEKDFYEKNDQIWATVAGEWISLSSKIKEMEKKEKELKETLISMSANQNSIGGGVKLTKILRKGTMDYSKIPELHKVNLESYRKEPIEFWKIAQI